MFTKQFSVLALSLLLPPVKPLPPFFRGYSECKRCKTGTVTHSVFLLCQGQCCLISCKVCVVHYNIDKCAPITQGWKFSPSFPETSVPDLSHIIQRRTWVNSDGTAHMLKHVANILIISELDVCLIAFFFYSPILYKTFLKQFNYKNIILIAWERKMSTKGN